MSVHAEVTAHLPEHVRALLAPDAYDHPAPAIELLQTHVSYVLLVGAHVYKLRKAIDLGFLDFTSLEQRKRDCLEEVRLNNRTCSTLYYGVVGISRDGPRYRLGGPGEIVDYAVHMRRLPAARMLSALLSAGEVSREMIGRLVSKIVRFHATAAGGRGVREIGGYQTMVSNWAANLEEARPFVGRTITREHFEAVREYADAFLSTNKSLLLRREEEGRVRDGHGDLRADAICFDSASPDGVCVFDCIEFSDRLRCGDTGLDIAFLAMDIERRGYVGISDVLLSLYTAACGDKTLPLVSSFFRSYRALIRGKVAGILLDQPGIAPDQRRAALAESRLHFELAAAYARPNLTPRVVLVMGLTGSGKSLLAGALAHRCGAALLSTDVVRKEMAGAAPVRRRPSAVGEGLYTPEMTGRVYQEIASQADTFLADGRAVILDGAYLTADLRAVVAALARRRAVPLLVVECRAPDAVIRERQERRSAEPWTASDATWEVYLSQKARYEPPAEVPPAELLRLATTFGLARELEVVLEKLT